MIEIRQGTLHDIAAIEHIFITSTLAMEGSFYSKDKLTSFLEYREHAFTKQHGSVLHYRKSLFDYGVNCLVAIENNKLLGFIYMYDFTNMDNAGIYKNTAALIMELYIFPSRFNQGIGSKLLHAMEILAVEQNITQLNVASSLNAKEFYINNGYEICKNELLPPDSQSLAYISLTKSLHKQIK